MPFKKSFAVLMCVVFAVMLGGCNFLIKTEPKETKIEYPTRPITMIVPFAPGNSMELKLRAMEKVLQKHLGQPMVIVNKPGGGGFIGWTELASSEPDGYTLGLSSTELLLQQYYGESKYHFPTALDPIAQFTEGPMILSVNTDQPWNTLDDLIQYGKQHPGELKSGHSGLGSISHILGETFAIRCGIQMEHVPFRGSSETTASLLGNHVQFNFATEPIIKEQIKAGKLRPLAVTGETRLTNPAFSDVPTFKELGIDLVLSDWNGIVSPKPLPPEVKEKLVTAFRQAILDPEYKKNMESLGVEPVYLGNDESLDRWVKDIKSLKTMITETGLLEKIQQQRK